MGMHSAGMLLGRFVMMPVQLSGIGAHQQHDTEHTQAGTGRAPRAGVAQTRQPSTGESQ